MITKNCALLKKSLSAVAVSLAFQSPYDLAMEKQQYPLHKKKIILKKILLLILLLNGLIGTQGYGMDHKESNPIKMSDSILINQQNICFQESVFMDIKKDFLKLKTIFNQEILCGLLTEFVILNKKIDILEKEITLDSERLVQVGGENLSIQNKIIEKNNILLELCSQRKILSNNQDFVELIDQINIELKRIEKHLKSSSDELIKFGITPNSEDIDLPKFQADLDKISKHFPMNSFSFHDTTLNLSDLNSVEIVTSGPIGLLALPNEIIGCIAFSVGKDRANLALTCKHLGSKSLIKIISDMNRQLKEEYWMQVNSLLTCHSIFDFNKSHFDFFIKVSNDFPHIFNKIDSCNLTALHKAILEKNIITTAFFMCHGVPRDIPGLVTEDDGQGNNITSWKTAQKLVEEGQYLPKITVTDHYYKLLKESQNRFENLRSCSRGYLLVSNHHSGIPGNLADDIEYLDLAINYPNAITETGDKYHGSQNRIIHDFLRCNKPELLQLFINAGANFYFDAPFLYSHCDSMMMQFLSEKGLLSKHVMQQLLICSAGNWVPDSLAGPTGSILSYKKDDLEIFEFILKKLSGMIDINAVHYGKNALTSAINSIGYSFKFQETQKKIDLLLSAGADPYYEFSDDSQINNNSMKDMTSPIFQLLELITSEFYAYESAEYSIKILKSMLQNVKNQNHLIKFVTKIENRNWYQHPKLCELLIGTGISPLLKDKADHTLLRNAIGCLGFVTNIYSEEATDEEDNCSTSLDDLTDSEYDSDVENEKFAFQTVNIMLDHCHDQLRKEDFDLTEFDESLASHEHIDYLKAKGFVFKK